MKKEEVRLYSGGMAIIEIHHTHADRLKGWEILKDSQGFNRFAIFRKGKQ